MKGKGICLFLVTFCALLQHGSTNKIHGINQQVNQTLDDFEQMVNNFGYANGSTKEEILTHWDDLASKLLAYNTQCGEVHDRESFVLQEYNVGELNEMQTFVLDEVTVEMDLPSTVPDDACVVLGILKLLHQRMALSLEDVTDDPEAEAVRAYEFGSTIVGINVIAGDGRYIPITNGASINMTLDLLPEHTICELYAMQNVSNSSENSPIPLKNPECYFFSSRNWSRHGCVRVFDNDTTGQVTCSCNHLSSFAVLMQVVDVDIPQKHQDVLHYLTLIGIAISIICLLITLILYGYFRLYKKPRVIIHANLALSLLIGQLIFVTGIDATPKSACVAVTVMLHYFFLTVFMWMLMEGIFLYIKMKPTIGWSMKPVVCIAVAWGCPIPVVASTVAIRYHYYGTNGICWLPRTQGIVYAFVAPALLVALVNGGILMATMKTFLQLKTNMDKSELQRLRVSLRALAILEPLLGCTWVFGILQFDTASAVVFGYLFVICNTLQGVFIFIAQCLMDEDISKPLRKRFRKQVEDEYTKSKSTELSNATQASTYN